MCAVRQVHTVSQESCVHVLPERFHLESLLPARRVVMDGSVPKGRHDSAIRGPIRRLHLLVVSAQVAIRVGTGRNRCVLPVCFHIHKLANVGSVRQVQFLDRMGMWTANSAHWGGHPTTSATTAFHACPVKQRFLLASTPVHPAPFLPFLFGTNPKFVSHEHFISPGIDLLVL